MGLAAHQRLDSEIVNRASKVFKHRGARKLRGLQVVHRSPSCSWPVLSHLKCRERSNWQPQHLVGFIVNWLVFLPAKWF